MSAVPREYREAIARYGHLADKEAKRYGFKDGADLLAKLTSGESQFNMKAVSSAGARGATQFMPATRQEFISKYKVDPWRSVDEAIHGAALFMRDRGLGGYNPGSPTYIDYLLGQKVSGVPAASGRNKAASIGGGAAGGELLGDDQRSGAVKALLWVAFFLSGAGLALTGLMRMVGLRARDLAGITPQGRVLKAVS